MFGLLLISLAMHQGVTFEEFTVTPSQVAEETCDFSELWGAAASISSMLKPIIAIPAVYKSVAQQYRDLADAMEAREKAENRLHKAVEACRPFYEYLEKLSESPERTKP